MISPRTIIRNWSWIYDFFRFGHVIRIQKRPSRVVKKLKHESHEVSEYKSDREKILEIYLACIQKNMIVYVGSLFHQEPDMIRAL